jgi:hypothetical protein
MFAVHCALALAVVLALVAGDPHALVSLGVLRTRSACVEVLDVRPGPPRCAGGRGNGRERARSRTRCARVRAPGGGRCGSLGAEWGAPPRCRYR